MKNEKPRAHEGRLVLLGLILAAISIANSGEVFGQGEGEAREVDPPPAASPVPDSIEAGKSQAESPVERTGSSDGPPSRKSKRIASSDARSVPPEAATRTERGYTLGYLVAERLTARGIDVDPGAFESGFRDAMENERASIKPARMRAILESLSAPSEPTSKSQRQIQSAEAQARADAYRAATRTDRTGSVHPPNSSPSGVLLYLDARLPSGQIDAATSETRANRIEADNPNLDEEIDRVPMR